MDDDNPDAYKPAPGDKDAKTKPSKHTLKYKKMFGESLWANIHKKRQRIKQGSNGLISKNGINLKEFLRKWNEEEEMEKR